MSTPLLATKLRVPPQPHNGVRRGRLIDTLAREIPGKKLTLIAAPAGYGKTTLLAQWAAVAGWPVVWLSLDETENDPATLFRYLLRGWEEVRPGVLASAPGLLLGGVTPDMEAVLATLINYADALPDDAPATAFVLDDYHLIHNPAVHEALTFLLDHAPPALHFVLAGRTEPPLPVARYRARGQLLEIGPDDLKFRPDEAEAFLNGRMELGLAADEAAGLNARLEGWIAGLQLAALGRRRGGDAGPAHLGDGRRFIADYLREDVFAPLPDAERRFLLQTALLDRLCAPLCDAVTGTAGGQMMLERLERENLFLAALDEEREWFRYHPLFADFLREELARQMPDQVADLHRRAAAWFFEHDLPEAAFHHAVEGNDFDRVAAIFERHATAMLYSGRLRVVQGWLEALPVDWLSRYPEIDLVRAALLVFSGELEDSIRTIDELEQRLTPPNSALERNHLAKVSATRCFIACFHNDLPAAEAFASQALRALSDKDSLWMVEIYGALGDIYRANRRWDESRRYYLEAMRIANYPGQDFMAAHVFGALADLELMQGNLRSAADFWRKASAIINEPETWGRLPLPLTGWVAIRLGEILYEWNRTAEAGDLVSRGLERAELGGDPQAMIAGYLLAGRLALANGAVDEALTYLEKARPLVESASFPIWTARFDRFQVECLLASGRPREALKWADRLPDGDPGDQPEDESAVLTLARALIARGDGRSAERALSLLKPLRAAAGAEAQATAIEADALTALARRLRGDAAGAMTALESALRAAEPEGYTRLFADLGLPMGRLLQEARARAVMPDYVETLLGAFAAPGATAAGPAPLPEPLTERETEVLRLIAAGLTNREIAERLVVSPETIKKHTAGIYGKLGVGNRTAAAARASELELLD